MFLERIPEWFVRYFNYKKPPEFFSEERKNGGLVEALFLYLIVSTLALVSSYIYIQNMSQMFSGLGGSSSDFSAAFMVIDYTPLDMAFQYISGATGSS